MSYIFLPIILILGTLLRFYNNTSVALWHDEAFSALFMRYPWKEMFYRIGLDVHPPLYYIILRLWTYFAGDGLLALRLLSILFGVLTIWAGYLFTKTAFQNKKLALLASFFLAINPFQIQYSLEARMYTLGTFLVMWSSYFLIKALESTKNKKYWLGYSLIVATSLYTHYYLLFSIAAQGLYIVLYTLKVKKIKPLFWAILAFCGSTILYLPWIGTVLEQVKRVQQSYWIPPMDRWSIPGTIWKMIFGGQGIRHSVLLTATIIATILIVYFIKRVRSFSKWLIVLGIAVPFVAAVVTSMKTNIYLDRYFVFASLFFTITVASAVYYIPNTALRSLLITILAVSVGFAFFKNWTDLGIKNKPGMTASAFYLNQEARPNDKIYVGSSFVFFTFKYYNQTNIHPLLYSPGKLETIPHFSGTALLSNDDLILDFREAKRGSTVWLLWTTGFGGSKPQVPANWKQIDEKGYQDSPGFKGWIVVTKYKVN